MSLLILLSPNISFSCVGTDPKQQTLPFQFKQGLLTRPFFSLGGLGLCQKVCICMPNLVMLITHFGQKRKYWPSKCPSRSIMPNFYQLFWLNKLQPRVSISRSNRKWICPTLIESEEKPILRHHIRSWKKLTGCSKSNPFWWRSFADTSPMPNDFPTSWSAGCDGRVSQGTYPHPGRCY